MSTAQIGYLLHQMFHLSYFKVCNVLIVRYLKYTFESRHPDKNKEAQANKYWASLFSNALIASYTSG